MLAILLDPDKTNRKNLSDLVSDPAFEQVDFLFVGGSLVTAGSMDSCMDLIKEYTDKTCVIFPGSPDQINSKADAILLLSLISGRNPDLLIGKHVESAFELKRSGLEVIPTAYILLDGGRITTVSYISNTVPIPQDKPEIASATALAGALMGNSLIYMDCGSGALYHADPSLVKQVKHITQMPIIIGGGIRSGEAALSIFNAGADLVVVGNKLEEDPGILSELVAAKYQSTPASTQKQ